MYDIEAVWLADLPEVNTLIMAANIVDEPMERLPLFCWVVRQEGRIVGTVSGEFVGAKTFVLHHLAVEKTSRKRGIGMLLFHFAIDAARAQGATTVSFLAARHHLDRFKKRGFVVTKREDLPAALREHPIYTSERDKKCAAMMCVWEG